MPKRLVEEVFVTEGVPEFTFVPPPNFGDILVDIRRGGKPVIIEGQSGTGKTTCVKKILDTIGSDLDATYYSARRAADVLKISELARHPIGGVFVIDDFHRLGSDIQELLADIAKAAAEEAGAQDLPKLVLIGINQIGSELIQLVPDIAKRTGIHRIKPGDQAAIRKLIDVGCQELNISLVAPDAVFVESAGDYWLTQQLCQTICTMSGVLETCDALTAITYDQDALRQRVVDRLSSAYYPAVKEFCRGRRFRPTNDPYYKLLRTVAEADSAIVDLNMLANSHEEVRGSINNIKDHRLAVLLESKPLCGRHFYYNAETKNFAIEDPALFYYMRHLDWEAVRRDCGFRADAKDFEYDIAISFAGENRDLARYIAEQLAILDAHVFYDEHFEANFLGMAWTAEFKRIFSDESRLVVVMLDANHRAKIWPTFERECFQPRVADAEVIPIFLDETPFLGIPQDIVGIKFSWDQSDHDWRDRAVDEIVFPIMARLS